MIVIKEHVLPQKGLRIGRPECCSASRPPPVGRELQAWPPCPAGGPHLPPPPLPLTAPHGATGPAPREGTAAGPGAWGPSHLLLQLGDCSRPDAVGLLCAVNTLLPSVVVGHLRFGTGRWVPPCCSAPRWVPAKARGRGQRAPSAQEGRALAPSLWPPLSSSFHRFQTPGSLSSVLGTVPIQGPARSPAPSAAGDPSCPACWGPFGPLPFPTGVPGCGYQAEWWGWHARTSLTAVRLSAACEDTREGHLPLV